MATHTQTQHAAPPKLKSARIGRAPATVGVLQRCGGVSCPPGTCDHDETPTLRRSATGSTPGHITSAGHTPGTAPPIVHQVLRSPGQPLDAATRAFMEPRFGHDFSRVRVHTDTAAALSAKAVGAHAYTVGHHVVMGSGRYQPNNADGRKLVAHELTHVIQQRGRAPGPRIPVEPFDGTAERQAAASAESAAVRLSPTAPALFRQRPGVQVRSPVFEETVTQASDLVGGAVGRPLTKNERSLAEPIFGKSIDYSRVRLVTVDPLKYRTVGNNIYIPGNFTINNESDAQTLIHELTHVWQYQRSGTSYISLALSAQFGAAMTRGDSNFAYDYHIDPKSSFFDFNPEQQGSIVENYFAMTRDQANIPGHLAAGVAKWYDSNHMGPDGFPINLTAADRLSEISAELPAHARLMSQVQAALPRSEADLLRLRAADVMQTPGQNIVDVPPERQLTPVRPIVEFRF